MSKQNEDMKEKTKKPNAFLEGFGNAFTFKQKIEGVSTFNLEALVATAAKVMAVVVPMVLIDKKKSYRKHLIFGKNAKELLGLHGGEKNGTVVG